MAYNLQPLITILEQILDHQQTCLMIHDENKPQLQSLLKKAITLQQSLEKDSPPDIERQIRDAVHQAEDIIKRSMVDAMLSNASLTEDLLIQRGEYITFSSPDLQQVMLELDSAMEQVVKLTEVEAAKKMISSSSSGGGASLNPKTTSSSASASGSIQLVGFDEDLMELKDRLTNMQCKQLEIIPIVGMGGAGKTTLARNLYEDPTIVSHFQNARAWATVSQDYNMRTILLSLVSCITGKQVVDEDVSVLKQSLYQSLYGRRYMIVLDDIWSTKFWDEMRMFFPDNKNGSRVMITTRESNVATYANSQSRQHEVQLLSESASWNLLRQIVFGADKLDDCPSELELIGRKMAMDCGGLPLALTVIGGLLSKVERSRGVWENIGENVRAAISESEEGEIYSNIMALSYKHLPNYLKPCFLYMGAFPEDKEIKGSRLIRLWMAEGFIKSNRSDGRSLEEEAEDYLKGLVERNLLIVRRSKLNKKPMSYIIHDLLRDLCIRKADEDRFLHVMRNARGHGKISKLRRVSSAECSDATKEIYTSSTELMSLARSFVCTYGTPEVIVMYIYSISNLLRVLDLRKIFLSNFPKEILLLVNLRYLGIWCYSCLPVGISRLVNLQTLIASLRRGIVPSEIWKMSELRYLNVEAEIISSEYGFNEFVQMTKLHSISRYLELCPSLLERGFLQIIPDIKNLGVYWAGYSEIDFSHLHKLETFRYRSLHGVGCRFPPSLRKLSLLGCKMNWRMMRILCRLQNLEVLKISGCDFELDKMDAQVWEFTERNEFRSLQFLELNELKKLVRWSADESNFPKLRHLVVRKCPQLVKIPSAIGEIPTLELIEMKECSASSVESAKQILEEQQSEYDNYALQLHIS